MHVCGGLWAVSSQRDGRGVRRRGQGKRVSRCVHAACLTWLMSCNAHTDVQYKYTAGLVIREDKMGNIYGTLPGSQAGAPAVATGSHCDAIPLAGVYDGTLGELPFVRSVWIDFRRRFQVVGRPDGGSVRWRPGRVLASERGSQLLPSVAASFVA